MNDDDAGVQAGYDIDYEDLEQSEFDPDLLRDKLAEELETIDVAQEAKEKENNKKNKE